MLRPSGMAEHVEQAAVQDGVQRGRTRTADEAARTRRDDETTSPLGRGWRFVKRLFGDAMRDSITNVGAMMAYYAILAIFPMIVFVITIALLVLDRSTVLQGVAMATEAMPPATADLIAGKVTELMATASGGFAIGSAAFALWGASRGAVSLSTALNAMFSKRETRPWWKRQLTAIAVTAGVAVIVVIALGLLVVGPIAGHWIADRFGLGAEFDTAWRLGRWIGAGVLVMVVWAIVYRFLPNTHAPFRIFTPGAFVGVLLWLGVSYLFGLYLSYFNRYEATYGALGAAIIFLTWLWLSNIAILFGAEINDVIADYRKHKSPGAAQLAKSTLDGSAEAQPNPVPPAAS